MRSSGGRSGGSSVLVLALVAVMALAAAPQPVGWELLEQGSAPDIPVPGEEGVRTTDIESPPNILVARDTGELVALYETFFPRRQPPTVDFDLRIVVGFDLVAPNCVPTPTESTVEGQTVRIRVADPDADESAPCPLEVTRNAYVVAVDQAGLPGGQVTVEVREDVHLLASTTVVLPQRLPETGRSLAELALAGATALAAGLLLLVRTRRRRVPLTAHEVTR